MISTKMSSERTVLLARVDKATQTKVKEIAATLGFVYAGEGSIGKMLDAIAKGQIILIKSN